MHIALIGAEFEENLSVRYLWSALENRGHTVTSILFNYEEEVEAVAQRLASSRAELTGLSMVFTSRSREFAAVATRARELGYRGHLTAGGHFAAFYAEQLLGEIDAIDSVVLGEGEDVLCDLAEALDQLDSVRGLVWRGAGGTVTNSPATKPPDLDVLPPPRRKYEYDRYLGLPITNILGSRGCIHTCTFCSIAAWHRLCGGARVRYRAPEAVAEEMADLYRRGVRIFNFHDDNFFLASNDETLARMSSLEAELSRHGVGKIAFSVKGRPSDIEETVLRAMKSMGLFRLFLGIEAGTSESLARLGRRQSVGDNVRALETINALDLHACFNLLVLNPDSTLEDFAGNVAFLRRHPANPSNFCRTEIYSGTPLEKSLRRRGRLIGDMWGYDYEIADPRAQRAFEVIFPAFDERNWGDSSLHCLAMQVDYEHQLLAHFFGRRHELRRRVKEYVVRVNLNTCENLEWALAALRDGSSSGEQRQFSEELRGRVAADDRRLGRQGRRLLDEIQAAARSREVPGRTLSRGAAAAGLAASITLSSPTLLAASPATESVPTQASSAQQPEQPLGNWSIVAGVVRPVVDRYFERAKKRRRLPITLGFAIDEQGRLGGVTITGKRVDKKALTALERDLAALQTRWLCDGYGKRFEQRLEPPTGVAERMRQTHMREMAPRPVCRSPMNAALGRIKNLTHAEVSSAVAELLVGEGLPPRTVAVNVQMDRKGKWLVVTEATVAIDDDKVAARIAESVRGARVSGEELRNLPPAEQGNCVRPIEFSADSWRRARFTYQPGHLFPAMAAVAVAPAFAKAGHAPSYFQIDYEISESTADPRIVEATVNNQNKSIQWMSDEAFLADIAERFKTIKLDALSSCMLLSGWRALKTAVHVDPSQVTSAMQRQAKGER